MTKIIVAGGRDYHDYNKLGIEILGKLNIKVRETPDGLKYDWRDYEIVSGGALGADSLGEDFAEENDIKLTIMRAEWDRYGKSAGYIRNSEMAEYGDMLIAFWDGKSKGTKHMIDTATKKGLKVYAVRY